jgi:hypothetical protein
VNTRLTWEEAGRAGWGQTLTEFQCTRRGGKVELEITNDRRRKSLTGMTRKWKVLKIFLDNEGDIIVDRWAINSTITYTGNEGTTAKHFSPPIAASP